VHNTKLLPFLPFKFSICVVRTVHATVRNRLHPTVTVEWRLLLRPPLSTDACHRMSVFAMVSSILLNLQPDRPYIAHHTYHKRAFLRVVISTCGRTRGGGIIVRRRHLYAWTRFVRGTTDRSSSYWTIVASVYS